MGSITKTTKLDRNPGKAITTYRAFVRRTVNGKSVGASKVFRRQQDAKDWLAENENRTALAALGRTRGPTFDDLIEQFVKAPARRGTRYWSASHLEFWRNLLGEMKTSDISRGDINAGLALLQNKPAMRATP